MVDENDYELVAPECVIEVVQETLVDVHETEWLDVEACQELHEVETIGFEETSGSITEDHVVETLAEADENAYVTEFLEDELDVETVILAERPWSITEDHVVETLVEADENVHATESVEAEAGGKLQVEAREDDLRTHSTSFTTEKKLKQLAQKQGLEVEANKMKELILNFESKWQLIIKQRKELQMEAECIAIERKTLDKILKDELNSLKLLKDEHNSLIMLRDVMEGHCKHDNESHSQDQEAFMITMEHERSGWCSKIQEERSVFLQGFKVQNKDLEDRLYKRCEELKSYLAEMHRAFKEEKKKILLDIDSLWETLVRETEQVNLELTNLDTKRGETNSDRKSRYNEWEELKNSIDVFNVQRQILQKQRQVMHADTGESFGQIEHLKQVEDNAIRFDASSGKRSGIISPPLLTPFSCLKRSASILLERSDKKIRQSEETRSPSMMSAQVDEHAVMSTNVTPVYANETSTPSAVHDEPDVIMPVNLTEEYANETCYPTPMYHGGPSIH